MNVEQFLYHEARLLDTQQYEAWLELFTDDATYWVPLEREQKDPFETSSIIHDDRTLLGLRVKQARHPRAHARLPLARTVHQVGNILVLKEDEPELLVASTLTLVEFRDRKSTRLNSSHGYISYAVFCLKKKKNSTNDEEHT